MLERYVLIDPTGINVVCQPIDEPIVLDPSTLSYSETTVTGQTITGASEARYNFAFNCDLGEREAKLLEALTRRQQTTGRETEIVAYFVFDKHVELGDTPTRQPLPGVAIETNSEDNTVMYYPVIQGDVIAVPELLGHGPNGQPRYRVSINFIEGTIRRPQP